MRPASQVDFKAVEAALSRHYRLRNVARSTPPSGLPKATAQHIRVLSGEIVGQPGVYVLIGIPRSFPRHLPDIYLQGYEQFGFVPHVDRIGKVCFDADEELIVDFARLPDVACQAVESAVVLLLKGLAGLSQDDLLMELEAYWREAAGSRQHLLSLLNPGSSVRSIWVNKIDNIFYLGEERGDFSMFTDRKKQDGDEHALYVPLEGTVTVEELDPSKMTDNAHVNRVIWANLNDENRRSLTRHLKRKPGRYLVLSAPKPDGGKSLVALWHTVPGGIHVLERTTDQSLELRYVQHAEQAYLAPRGGASSGLAERRVVLVGCGSVGGYLAQSLAGVGISRFTLVDPGVFAVDNLMRHVLGMAAIGKKKVDALTDFLQASFPYLQIKPEAKPMEQWLDARGRDLGAHDIVVIAIGDPTESRWLNDTLRQRGVESVLFVWQEPLGIGGHALLAGSRGCYECLFASGGASTPISDFAEAGQGFRRDLTGCGSGFIPYSGLDVLRTVDLAADLVVKKLLGEVDGPALQSWCGAAAEFHRQDYKVTSRYQAGVGMLDGSDLLPQPGCPVCA